MFWGKYVGYRVGIIYVYFSDSVVACPPCVTIHLFLFRFSGCSRRYAKNLSKFKAINTEYKMAIDYNITVLLADVPSDRDISGVGIEKLMMHYTYEQLIQCIKHCRKIRAAFADNNGYSHVGKHLYWNLGMIILGCQIVGWDKFRDNSLFRM